ncbi:MAG: sigma-70 family RNA polymerase sigma factor [Rhodocyclaceae bacterium]|nr:sigma-70 family RNA polymerase sigma factor [Rhodocyclaceae bacterium]
MLDLLGRIGDGDEEAFGELYRAFNRRIYAYALNLLRDADLAEKATSDAMFDVWRYPQRFDGSSAFATWLIAIVRHKAFDALRSLGSWHEDIDDYADTLEGNLSDGFAALAEKQRREGVRKCMARLPPEQMECLHLSFYEGMAQHEIAALQGCAENTVKTRMFHARRKIKTCLERWLSAEAGNG